MADNDVDIRVVGDDRQILMMWQRQNNEILKNQQKLVKLGMTGKRSSQQVKGGFDSALGTFGKFAGAITGVGGLIGGVTLAARQLLTEFERIKDLQKTDAEKQIEFESSLVQTVRNARGNFTGEEIKKKVLDLEVETGVAPVKIADVISSALSARGATNKKQAQEAVDATRAALKYAPELTSEQLASIAGSGIDLSKRFGFTPEEALGFSQNVGALARIPGQLKLAKNVIPAVNNMSQFGNNAQESGSLVAAITQGAGDDTGEMSGTAAVQLAKQIRDRGLGSSTAEGIKMLQDDPKLRKKFLEGGTFNGKTFPKASFEAKTDPTIRNLLDPGSFIAKSYAEGIKKLGGAKEAQATFDELIADNKLLTPTSRMQRQTDAAADSANIKDVVGGQAASTRHLLEKAFDSANISDIRKNKILIPQFEFLTKAGQNNPLEVAAELLKREQEYQLRTQDEITSSAGLMGGEITSTVPNEVTEEERQSAGVLKRFERILDGFIKEQKRANQPPQQQAIEENTKALKDNNRLREKEQRTPSTAPVPQRSKEPFKLSAEKLSRGD